jgi:tripartite-type tricarboxylate transporter receptor subunit TctC
MTHFGPMLKIAAGALALCVCANSTWAQSYPTRTIKIVVPAPSGGPMDLYGRLAAQIIQQELGATVVVENRAGAGGATATKSVATAAPDGYSLLVANTTTLGVIPATTPDVGFDPVKSFAPVAKLADSATALVVSPALPANSVHALVEYAKAQPGKLDYASVGISSLPHLQAETFRLRTGIEIVHVPFKSGPEMVTAVLGQHVHMAFAEMSVILPLMKEHRLKALAVSSLQRQPKLEGVPTMIESGIADFTFPMWTGIVAPAGTSADIVERLNRVIQIGLKSQQIAEALVSSGAQPASGSVQSFSDFLKAETARWSAIAHQAGMKSK